MANNLREGLYSALSKMWAEPVGLDEMTDATLAAVRKWLESEETLHIAVRALLSEEAVVSPRQRLLYGHQPYQMTGAALKSLSANLEGTGE